jgi:predicted O-methyltransferase YrrM
MPAPSRWGSMKVIDILGRTTGDTYHAARSLTSVGENPAALVGGGVGRAHRLGRGFDQVVDGLVHQSDLLRPRLKRVVKAVLRRVPRRRKAPATALRNAMQQMPLLRAERTYNTSHPDYDASLVRNFPGRIFNHHLPCDNPSFRALARLGRRRNIPNRRWNAVLRAALAEASSVPHAGEVFERRAFVERYVSELATKYRSHYVPGWVNLDDALFLYWLVRQAKPRMIVQTGVCNGLSAAFMMLALVKNGPEGRLRVIDLPPVFDPDDPAWTVAGTVYGVVIPEGKTSGWLVPDAYRDRFEVWNGDAKDLLPKMVDDVDSIDFFFHDSDHTYDHMMFEFRQVKSKLTKGGLLVSDDVSWNASVWDFADEFHVPSYNFKGTIGVAFF